MNAEASSHTPVRQYRGQNVLRPMPKAEDPLVVPPLMSPGLNDDEPVVLLLLIEGLLDAGPFRDQVVAILLTRPLPPLGVPRAASSALARTLAAAEAEGDIAAADNPPVGDSREDPGLRQIIEGSLSDGGRGQVFGVRGVPLYGEPTAVRLVFSPTTT